MTSSSSPILRVDVHVIVDDHRLERVARLVAVVRGSMYCQKAWWTRSVPISTIMKKSQGLVVEQVAGQGEPLVGHPDEGVADLRLVGRAEVADVELVGVDVGPAGDLGLQLGGIGVVATRSTA